MLIHSGGEMVKKEEDRCCHLHFRLSVINPISGFVCWVTFEAVLDMPMGAVHSD